MSIYQFIYRSIHLLVSLSIYLSKNTFSLLHNSGEAAREMCNLSLLSRRWPFGSVGWASGFCVGGSRLKTPAGVSKYLRRKCCLNYCKVARLSSLLRGKRWTSGPVSEPFSVPGSVGRKRTHTCILFAKSTARSSRCCGLFSATISKYSVHCGRSIDWEFRKEQNNGNTMRMSSVVFWQRKPSK